MKHRYATDEDLDVLAEWNHQLIQDEGHRNPMDVPHGRVWPGDKRLTVEVLTANEPAVAFWRASGWRAGDWRAVGYRDFCLTLEILPKKVELP